MIDSLTEEQKKQITAYRDKWIKLSTEPADRPRAERGVHLLCESLDLPQPKAIIWLDSLSEILRLPQSPYYMFNSGWAAQMEFLRDILGVEAVHKLDGAIELAASCGLWWVFSDICILTERQLSNGG